MMACGLDQPTTVEGMAMTLHNGRGSKRTSGRRAKVRVYISGASSAFDPSPRPVRVRGAGEALEQHRVSVVRYLMKAAGALAADPGQRPR